MPYYSYECTACSKPYEDFVRLRFEDGKDLTVHPFCPFCHAEGKKVITAANFKINGYSEKNGYSKNKS